MGRDSEYVGFYRFFDKMKRYVEVFIPTGPSTDECKNQPGLIPYVDWIPSGFDGVTQSSMGFFRRQVSISTELKNATDCNGKSGGNSLHGCDLMADTLALTDQ